jgi:hypothetical protein
MKKFLLLFTAAGLMLGGTAFAKEDNGALGFGVISDSADSAKFTNGIRGNIFLDVGYQLTGPLFYGFELQGDVKQVSSSNSDFSTTDASIFQVDDSTWIGVFKTNQWTLDVKRWDLDFSPRGYISFDLGDKIQLLGFAGLNYNWNSIDYTITNKTNSSGTLNSGTSSAVTYAAGESKTNTTDVGGVWDVIAGARISVGAFYLDYTRFLKPTTSGDYSWNSATKNRLGLGINLRF